MESRAGTALFLAREQLGLLKTGEIDAFLAQNDACFDACQAAMDEMSPSPEAEAELAKLAALTRAISEQLAVLMEETSARTQQLARRRQAATAYMGHTSRDALSTRDL